MDFGYSAFEGSEVYAAAHLGLSGDPYREEPVRRGVSMAVGTMSPQRDHAWQSCAFGLGEVLDRSAGTDVPTKPEAFTSEFTYPFGLIPSESKPRMACGSCNIEIPLADRFATNHSPPPLPTDTFFQLESTTLRVSAAPFHLGNALLDVLLAVVVCVDVKVDCDKFSIKATVFYKSSTCSVKLRVYEVTPGSYVVEFQRRQGDCTVFMDMYHEFVKHLASDQQCSLVVGSVPVADATLEPPVKDTLEAEDLSSLINIVAHRQTQPVDVLEDVAMALARAAQDVRTAPLLCESSALMALENLVQDSLVSVALPAAKALHALTQHQESKHFFARDGLSEVARVRLRATPSGKTALRHELARVLQAVAAELP